jgi:hypothetical protein
MLLTVEACSSTVGIFLHKVRKIRVAPNAQCFSPLC